MFGFRVSVGVRVQGSGLPVVFNGCYLGFSKGILKTLEGLLQKESY